MADTNDLEKIWSSFGLNPQAFPIYYPMGPKAFLDGAGNPSGAVGATASLSRDLSNFPHMFLGLRVTNTYTIGAAPNADAVNLFRTLKEWVDGEQSITVNLAQQSISLDRVQQSHMTGRAGWHWHPFPVPFPMAGANTIACEIVRTTAYPALNGAAILPQCHVTIVAAVLRADLKTIAPHRVHGGM